MVRPEQILAGGQTGVDQAALQAALDLGLGLGGWCPPGRVCESGVIPQHFPLRPTPEERSESAPDVARSLRTEWNVRDSDATLLCLPSSSTAMDAGTAWTKTCAQCSGRPMVQLDPWQDGARRRLHLWLGEHRPVVLNIAGPSEQTCPGIGARVYDLLIDVLGSSSKGNSDVPQP